jgi:uncharacterized protein YjiS (DUF1127 family)
MNTIALSRPAAHGSLGLGRAAASLWARWQHARRLHETRRYLEQMDDRMLQDIGVSRAQALFEIGSRPEGVTGAPPAFRPDATSSRC